MPFTGKTDEANQFSLSGSVTSETFPSLTPFVDIMVNRRFVARVPAKNFTFNPFETLSPGRNVVELFVAGTDRLLENGVHHLEGGLPQIMPSRPENNQPVELFMDEVQILAPDELGGKVWAMGARLEKAVLNLGSACEPPKEEEGAFDLALAANECEYWFPSIAQELDQIYRALRPGGKACLDFPCDGPALTVSRGVYENMGASFRRVYSEPELRGFFLDAGLEIIDIVICENKRAIVAARKPEMQI